MRLPMRTKGGRPVTTNNDTPRIFSDGADEAADAESGVFGREWRGEPDAAWFGWEEQSGPADGYPQPSSDAADEAADAESGVFGREWRGEPDAAWFGWEEQSGPADGYPQPSSDAADE